MRRPEGSKADFATRVIVYVGDAASNDITAFARSVVDGRLELVQRLPLPAGVGPLTLSPDRRFLYAFLRSYEPAVLSLAIDPATGKLDTLATTPVAHQLVYIDTDRSGRHLLGASYTRAVFAIHGIDESGVVVAEPTQLVQTPPHAHCTITDPTNRYLFVTSLGGDVILQYVFDAATGRVRPNDPPFIAAAKGSGPRHLTFHPTADVAYINGELDGSIAVYRLSPRTGLLQEVQRVDAMPPDAAGTPWAADVHVSPDGRYVYASERRTSTLATFAVDKDSGLLDPRGTIATETQPRSFAIDPNGRFVVVAGEKSQQLVCYERDPQSGALAVEGCYPLGRKPAWVTVAALPRPLRQP